MFPEDKNRAKKEFKIWLVYNGVNYYALFYGKELADLILDGDPVMLQIQKTYQDVKNIVKWLPKDTRINGSTSDTDSRDCQISIRSRRHFSCLTTTLPC